MSATCIRAGVVRQSRATLREVGARSGLGSSRACRTALLALASVTLTAAMSPALAQRPMAGPPEFLQGKLIDVEGQLTLKAAPRDYILSGKTSSLLHTLQDQRLLNREVRLEGTLKADGTFEVAHLFTVRDGKLYKVRYYCNICNIAALEPGNCVCCQRPTELQEIPLSEVGKDTVVVP
jgi:hypothetical protein